MEKFIFQGLAHQLCEKLKSLSKDLEPYIHMDIAYQTDSRSSLYYVIRCEGKTVGGDGFKDRYLLSEPDARDYALITHDKADHSDNEEPHVLITHMRQRKTLQGWNITDNCDALRDLKWRLPDSASVLATWVMEPYQQLAEAVDKELQEAYENREFVPVKWLQHKNLLLGTLCEIQGREKEGPILIGHATPTQRPEDPRFDRHNPRPWSDTTKVRVLARLLADEPA